MSLRFLQFLLKNELKRVDGLDFSCFSIVRFVFLFSSFWSSHNVKPGKKITVLSNRPNLNPLSALKSSPLTTLSVLPSCRSEVGKKLAYIIQLSITESPLTRCPVPFSASTFLAALDFTLIKGNRPVLSETKISTIFTTDLESQPTPMEV